MSELKDAEFVESNPNIFGGQPVLAGTRLLVSSVVSRVADGDSVDDLVKDYPHISREAFEAALRYRSEDQR